MMSRKIITRVTAPEDPEHERPRADNYDDAEQMDDRDGEDWAALSRLPEEEADQYTEDWSKLSRQIRQEMDYQCELCGLSFADDPLHLHVHHRNGCKSDNRRSNLQVLCADCHAKQPGHSPFD